MTLTDIKNKLTALKPELHERFGVSEIGVFGSWVRGEEKKTSDIDMLVSFDRRVDLFDLMELEEFLQEIFQCKIDLALKRSLKPLIGKHILAEVEYL
ncbi:MAG: nucleotidyltransferase family protein [Phycisphaerae bacterium]|nr:nucleotidyltransferase family protein [Saprospiraceae bacterium]